MALYVFYLKPCNNYYYYYYFLKFIFYIGTLKQLENTKNNSKQKTKKINYIVDS